MENERGLWQEMLNTKIKLRGKSEKLRIEVVHLVIGLKKDLMN
jgi:hypothetical protein